jgi:hypothetical protein
MMAGEEARLSFIVLLDSGGRVGSMKRRIDVWKKIVLSAFLW